MKKWLAVFTCGLLLSAGVCMSQAEGAGEDTLYEKGKEIAELVIDAVRSEDYVNLYSASEDVSNLLKEVGTAEWAEPEAVYEVTVSDAFYKTLDEAGALNNLSEELAKIVKSKLFTSMVYQISEMCIRDRKKGRLFVEVFPFLLKNDFTYQYKPWLKKIR